MKLILSLAFICLMSITSAFGACPTWSATGIYNPGSQVCYSSKGYQCNPGWYGISGAAYGPGGAYGPQAWKLITTCDCGGTTTYSVSYNGNSSTGGTVPASQTVASGTSITLPAQGTLLRTGYSFGGWNTNAAGTGTNYSASASYTVTATATLYAKWTAATTNYTVTYSGNSNTSGAVPASQTVASGTSITLPAQGTLLRTGYSFGGWNTNAAGTGTNYSASAPYTVTATVTLYARWTASTTNYTVTYSGNSNTGGSAPASQTVVSGTTITLPAQGTLVRTGYSYGGWNTNSAGTGTNYSAGASYTVNETITLYALWTPVSTAIAPDHQWTGTSLQFKNPEGTLGPLVNLKGVKGDKGNTGLAGTVPNGSSVGDVRYWNGSAWVFTPVGKTGQLLNVSAANTPVWTDQIPPFISDIDGNIYHTVTIGTQTWTIENLNVKKLNDGTPIPLVTDNTAWSTLTTPGYCYYDNADFSWDYGALYNWHAVGTNKLAPAGWHVATYADWTELNNYLGGTTLGGGKLKEAGFAHWLTPNTGATNENGFSALPGGGRSYNGGFNNQSINGFWWSATAEDATNASGRYLSYNSSNLYRSGNLKGCGFSVRLVRD